MSLSPQALGISQKNRVVVAVRDPRNLAAFKEGPLRHAAHNNTGRDCHDIPKSHKANQLEGRPL
jgi:hypothetical protein